MRHAPFAFLALALVLTGCTSASPTPTPSESAAAPHVTAIPAEETCKRVSTLVLTPIANAEVGFMEERLVESEVIGARAMAAQSLRTIEAEPGTEIAAALAELQDVPSYTDQPEFDPKGEEWVTARDELSDACESAGHELYISMWTGG